jgi:hypothetical protein
MESRYSLWLMSTCASVLLFVGQRLETLGNVIACEVERRTVARRATCFHLKGSG